MKTSLLITGLLAATFCISGHFFMAAYTDSQINNSKLEMLRNQERSFKRQIIEYEDKIKQLGQIRFFMNQIQRFELGKDQWDPFYVDLKSQPLSFEKLKTALNQTGNSRFYYFKPTKLSIKTGEHISEDDNKESTDNQVSQITDRIKSVDQTETSEPSKIDVTVDLNGRFIVKRRGAG